MSGFYTKERNDNGEYEITFYTENRQDFEKVQDLCRELIDHNKPVSNEGDLISRSELKKAFDKPFWEKWEWEFICKTIDNTPTVAVNCKVCDGYEAGYSAGLKDAERLQGEWFLVGERLPEKYKEVIVTDIETTETYCSWYHGNGYWECDNGVLKNRIIAWQPLPEPYKGGDNNE